MFDCFVAAIDSETADQSAASIRTTPQSRSVPNRDDITRRLCIPAAVVFATERAVGPVYIAPARANRRESRDGAAAGELERRA